MELVAPPVYTTLYEDGRIARKLSLLDQITTGRKVGDCENSFSGSRIARVANGERNIIDKAEDVVDAYLQLDNIDKDIFKWEWELYFVLNSFQRGFFGYHSDGFLVRWPTNDLFSSLLGI